MNSNERTFGGFLKPYVVRHRAGWFQPSEILFEGQVLFTLSRFMADDVAEALNGAYNLGRAQEHTYNQFRGEVTE